ncbi:MAG: hypothetical protein GX442_08445 [Candidatus Riflebacteria bacterium]|nr:hypothetical protein [Candidatus Riflebacteria bacterium]
MRGSSGRWPSAARVPLSRGRRGSTVFLIAFGILVLLAMVAAFFSHFMKSTRAQTHRLGESRLMAQVARALAVLATHKIQYDLLDPAGGDDGLRTWLAGPLAEMPRGYGEFPLELVGGRVDFQAAVDALTVPIREQGPFRFRITFAARAADFQGLSKLPAEKVGVLRLTIVTTLKETEEEFHFQCPIRVTAAVVPGVSKFSLFVEDAATDEAGQPAPWQYNLVSANPDGQLKSSAVQPLVLRNGPRLDPGSIEWGSFFRKRVGLVYLGGGPLYLNMARGESRAGEFGEGRWFFETRNRDQLWDGLYAVRDFSTPQTCQLMEWHKPVADERGDTLHGFFFEAIADTPEAKYMRFSSIFRLFGTDVDLSPTLVIGKVFRSAILLRAVIPVPNTDDGPIPPLFLKYFNDTHKWRDALNRQVCYSANETFPSIATFARDALGLSATVSDLEKYQREYASRAGLAPYNISLAYYTTNNTIANPFTQISDTRLRDRMASSSAVLDQLPEEFGAVLDGQGRTGVRLDGFLQSLDPARGRPTWVVEMADPGQLFKPGGPLHRRGLWHPNRGELDPKGWIVLQGRAPASGLVLPRMKLLSNGGLVLEEGDILIKETIDGDLDPARDPLVLQVVARKGSITVKAPTGRRVDVALAAAQRVRLEGGPHLRGGVAMKRYEIRNASSAALLEYNPALAVLPACAAEFQKGPGSEVHDVLGYSLDPTPLLTR